MRVLFITIALYLLTLQAAFAQYAFESSFDTGLSFMLAEIEVAPNGNIYVGKDHRLPPTAYVFSLTGAQLNSWAVGVSSPGQGDVCWGVGSDSHSNLVVATRLEGVSIFSPTGILLARWPLQPNGSGPPSIWSLACDQNDRVYVGVQGVTKRVEKYGSDGTFLGILCSDLWPGSQDGPTSIDFDALNNVYVASGYNVLHKFSSDGIPLGTMSYTEIPGYDSETNVWGVAISGNRLFLVNNFGGVTIHDLEGHYLATLAQSGTGLGEVHYPWAISISPNGDVLVGDYTGRIQRWAEAPIAVMPTTWSAIKAQHK